jgi:DNA-binding beta-propeller fold protein YncE
MRSKFLFLLSICLVVACKKTPSENTPSNAKLEHGILVLEEGLFQQNNAALTWIDTQNGSINLTFFEQQSNRSLGDTGNDLKRYGNKIYVVVNVSSTLEILNATTGKSIKQLPFFVGNIAKQPRSIAFNGAKAFVTCYDGFVDVIDTLTLTIEQRIPVGPNPEGIGVANGKLYIANSGGLNFPSVDSTVSVVSLQTLQEITRIPVGLNPGALEVDQSGNVFVISRGNYSNIPARLHKINSLTDQKETTIPLAASSISLFGSQFLIAHQTNGSTAIALFDPLTSTIISSNFLDLSPVQTLYGISYSPITSKIYCCDARNYTSTGYVHVYDNSGNYLTNYHVGLNPSKVLIYE